MTPRQDFDDAYEKLSLIGRCDSPGGAEYRRVLAEWLDAGQPQPIPFIVERA